jgi:hypothetical protein
VSGKIDTYLTVAATFTSVSAGEGLSTDALQILDELLDASAPIRRGAIDRAKAVDPDVRSALVRRLIERAGAVGGDQSIETAADISKGDPQTAAAFHQAVSDFAIPFLTPSSVLDVASVPGAEDLLGKIAVAPGVEDDVRGAANEELKSLRGES